MSHGQNTSFTPDYYSNLHFMWMYCKVSSNSTLVAEGRKLINVHGRSTNNNLETVMMHDCVYNLKALYHAI